MAADTEYDDEQGDEPRWLTSEERSAWLAVTAFTTKLPGALDAQLQRDAGLSFFEYMVMAVLSEQPSWTLQMSDIAQGASASLSRLSHTATRLENKGYLVRSRCPGAGRRTNATLTQAGYDKVVETAPSHVAMVRHLFIDAVSPDQLNAIRDGGRAILERIDSRDLFTDVALGLRD